MNTNYNINPFFNTSIFNSFLENSVVLYSFLEIKFKRFKNTFFQILNKLNISSYSFSKNNDYKIEIEFIKNGKIVYLFNSSKKYVKTEDIYKYFINPYVIKNEENENQNALLLNNNNLTNEEREPHCSPSDETSASSSFTSSNKNYDIIIYNDKISKKTIIFNNLEEVKNIFLKNDTNIDSEQNYSFVNPYVGASINFNEKQYDISFKKDGFYNFYVKGNIIDKYFIHYYLYNYIGIKDKYITKNIEYIINIYDENFNLYTFNQKDKIVM